MLSPKPADEYVWNGENEYSWGDLAWYKGIWYQFLPDQDPDHPEPPTTAPNVAEMAYYSYDPLDSTNKESRNFRVWVMIDPMYLSIDPSAIGGYEGSFGDKSAAAIRRLPGITDGENPSCYNFTSKVGTTLPALSYESTTSPGTLYRNTKYSWNGQRTKSGESIEIVSEGGLSTTGPMSSISIPEMNSSDGGYATISAASPIFNISAPVSTQWDDSALQDSEIAFYQSVRPASIGLSGFNESPPADITTTRTATYVFSREYDPGIATLFGRVIGLKLKVLCLTLQAYYYKTPWIEDEEDEDIVAYKPSGGTLQLIHPLADGILIERRYRVVAPWDPPVWVELDEKSLTVGTTYDAYEDTGRTEKTLTGTVSYKEIVAEVIYWKPQDTTFL